MVNGVDLGCSVDDCGAIGEQILGKDQPECPWKGNNKFLRRGIGLPGRKREGVSL